MKKRKMDKNSTIIIFVPQSCSIDVSMLFHNAVIIGMKLIYVWSLITKLNHKKQS